MFLRKYKMQKTFAAAIIAAAASAQDWYPIDITLDGLTKGMFT